MLRSPVLGIDETLCAIQGYAGAYAINAIRGVTVFAPLNAAVCFGGVAFIEKLIYQVSRRIIPGFTASLGPIPIGTKNIVSHGLAIYTTLKIMEVAGLILNVPQEVTIIGLTCAAALVVSGISGIKALIQYNLKSFDEHLQDHLNSKIFSNVIFCFKHENKNYNIRVICNPEKIEVVFKPNGSGNISCKDTYILACNDTIPEEFFTKFPLAKKPRVFETTINSVYPLDYTDDPIRIMPWKHF